MRHTLCRVKKDETVSLMSPATISQDKTSGRLAEPRQKRAVATRANVLVAVECIVAAEGAEAVTTTRVAEETGVAVGTIYRYFSDRDAMLLEAYDATVERIVGICHAAIEALPQDGDVNAAARDLLSLYLNAAQAIPAHRGLLAAMRRLRPTESAVTGGDDRIVTEIIAPFLARFSLMSAVEPVRLRLMSTVIGTLVDLYLVTPDAKDRDHLRGEIDAHMLFMLARAAIPR